MRRSLVLAASLLVIPAAASAQQAIDPQRLLVWSVTAAEATIILNKIGELPWRDINPVMKKLIDQTNAQVNPPPDPSVPAKPKE